jgi:hypothetical protein
MTLSQAGTPNGSDPFGDPGGKGLRKTSRQKLNQ